MLDGQFGIKLVYSFSIGLSCWVVIDGGRTALAAWRRRRGVLDNERVGWAGVVPLIIVGAVLGPLLGMAIGDALTGGQSIPLWRLSSRSTQITMAVTVLAILVSTLVASANDKAADQALRAQAAQREAAEAQLRLLQSQLEPHMLFNTLANLRVLIGLDPARAQAMLDRLIAFLRSTLAASRAQEHALSDEFARLDDYLALMQVRMGARLQVCLDLPPALAALQVPPLLLQPLVENAIKHAISMAIGGGSIAVSAQVAGDALLLTVADDGPGMDQRPERARKGGGVGLANTRERLRELYGNRQSFRLGTTDPHGLTITIRIPLELESKQT